MRVPFVTIKKDGKRVSPYSKFYIYNDMLFEPVYLKGKICKNYKAIEDKWRVKYILMDAKKNIPKVSEIDPDFKGFKIEQKQSKNKINDRFDILDL